MAKTITPKEYAIFLYETGDVKACLEVLQKNNDLYLIDKVIKEFESYDKQERGIEEVEITSAKPLSEKVKKEILHTLHNGKKVELIEKVRPELIGGIVVKIEDTLIDGSLKTKLARLNQSLFA